MSASAYGATARALHRLALASPMVAQASHDLETLMNRQAVGVEDGAHVFVAGLARAGTTVVMSSLYQEGGFRSLTYRDMPFVLMPKTWSGLSSLFRRHKEKEERAHGDRLLVDFDSPEAFEEVFWRSFCGNDYIFADALRPHQPDADILDQYRRFVRNVLASEGTARNERYLSKNNNNLLRLTAISEAFPSATIVIPFRDPVQHALSLKRQHALFCATHAQDPFALEYMNWLGHHEFGGNHRPFRFGELPAGAEDFTPDSLDYWLCCWIDAYRHVLKNRPPNATLFSYEELCKSDHREEARLFERAGLRLDASAKKNALIKAKPHSAQSLDTDLIRLANELHSALLAAR